jgi:hypothetical protein
LAPQRYPALLPVVAVEGGVQPEPRLANESSLEIVLGDATIRVRGAVDAQQLRTVVDCLARRP